MQAMVAFSLMAARGAAADAIPATSKAAGSAAVAEAEVLFNAAKALMAAGRAREACPNFEASQKLDPGAGTQFFLADCMEAIGRLARAHELFSDLDSVLVRVNDPRGPIATQRVRVLAARLPTITLRINPSNSSTGLTVMSDGHRLSDLERSRPLALDPGRHVIEVRAEGKVPWRAEIDLRERQRVTLDVPVLAEPASVQPVVEPRAFPMKATALVVGGIGLASLAAGGVLLAVAKGRYDDAVAGCTRDGDSFECPAGSVAKSDGDDATAFANGAFVLAGVGAVGLATGAVLWLTATKPSPPRTARGTTLVPEFHPDAARVTLRGTF